MANAAPVITGASVVVSDGLVFVRVSEMDAAHRTIVRASTTAAGGTANGASGRPSISKNARQVAFESTATNLTAQPLPPSPYQGEGRGEVGLLNPTPPAPRADATRQSRLTSYVVDLRGGAPQALQLDSPMLPPGAAAIQPWLSGDGRYVAVAARDTNGISQIFVYDRDHDGNGVFDEPGGTATVLLSRSPLVAELQPGDGDSFFPFISSTGRFVTFASYAGVLWGKGQITAGSMRAFYVDRDFAGRGIFDDWEYVVDGDKDSEGVYVALVDRSGVGSPADAPVTLQPPSVSAAGDIAAFATFDRNILPRDDNDFCLNLATTSPTCADVVVSRSPGSYHLTNVGGSFSSLGEQANNHSLSPMLSADGHSVAYASAATNLVPGDTNGAADIFVHDMDFSYTAPNVHPAPGTTTRASVASDGSQANGGSFDSILGISDEGRYVAFASTASNLVPGDTNDLCDNDLDGRAEENCSDIFIHDRATGFTERASVAASGAEGNGASRHAALSGDGRTVAFESTASNLVPDAHNDVCDNHGDGVAQENCSDVFVAGPDRTDPTADFNGDGDANDTLLAVFDTQQPNSRLTFIAPAGQVAINGERAAFLSPEQDSETDLNGDGDTTDSVVQLYTGRDGHVINLRRAAHAVAMSERWLAALVSEKDEERDLNGDGKHNALVVHVTPSDGTEPWTNLGVSGIRLDVAGDTVAVATLESDENKDLNGDGDREDRVLQLYDARTGTLINTGQAIEEFVLGPDVVAFRTSEAAQGQDLNGDVDTGDIVMQVYDVRTRRLINTGQTAIPCVYEACDPRVPYRVTADSVKFLTLESQQGQDLNGNGTMDDLVLQTFNIPKALAAMDAQLRSLSDSGVRSDPTGSGPAEQTPTAGRFQRSERRRADGTVLAGPLTTLGAVSVGICSDTGRACASATDCGATAHCYLPPGGCVTNLHTACDTTLAINPCGEHQYCVPTKVQGHGDCYLSQGTCTSDADCTAPARCQAAGQSVQRLISPLFTPGSGHVVFTAARADGRLAVVGARDSDGDGIADPFDNCPYVANADQADANANGVGDACEASAPAPSPTAVATVTAQPTASPTESRSPTVLASRTPAPSVTPAPAVHGEGCAVGARKSGSVAYAVLVGACVLWGMRRRTGGRGE
jgi:hypothetical protein